MSGTNNCMKVCMFFGYSIDKNKGGKINKQHS